MKRNFLSALLILLIISLSNIFGRELTTKIKLNNDKLLLPLKIVISTQIYIFDRGEESVRIFDRHRNLINSFGKKGEGPGEFLCGTDFCIYKERVYIIDTCKSKLEIFTEDGKHLGSRNINVSNPFKIAIDNEKIYISSLAFLKGQKIITSLVLEEDLKTANSFLDCIPLEGINLGKIYKNAGILAASKGKVYFAYVLSNKVLEFSEDGKLLKEYLLPLKPIDKAEIDRKGSQMLLKSALNYDMRAKGDHVYILSRNEQGNSLIFGLIKGRFEEMFKIKEKLINFDISENEIWGIEEEEGEVLIYKVK